MRPVCDRDDDGFFDEGSCSAGLPQWPARSDKRLHRPGHTQCLSISERLKSRRRRDVLGESSPSANQGHCSQLSNVSLVSRSPPPPPPTLLFDHQTVSFLSRRIGLFLSLVAMIQPASLVLATGVNSERHE